MQVSVRFLIALNFPSLVIAFDGKFWFFAESYLSEGVTCTTAEEIKH